MKTQASTRKKPRKKSQEAVAPEIPARVARRERRRGIAATTLDAVAQEVGLTKAALYYYYPSKDALLFEIMFETVERLARSLHDGVAKADNGGGALRAILRETVATFSSRLDDFRLAFLHPQVVGPGGIRIGAEQFARIRPLNDLSYKGAAKMLSDDWKGGRGRAGVDPRLMVFLANVSALGILTMKGFVESLGDPLLYSDEQLIDGVARIFEAAAAP